MPRKRSDRGGELPLPEGWEQSTARDGKVFYIDHHSKKTTWIDPRDRYTKPQSFADCNGDELPYGWEQSYHPSVGSYFINHVTEVNQLEDPRTQWIDEQQSMLKDYVSSANQDLMAKKEILSVKQERLAIAQEEVDHLNDTIANWKSSHVSLNSTSSYGSKYDPDLLKSEVALAKKRVERLKRELAQIGREVKHQEKGVETLAQVEQKVGDTPYNISEAQDIMSQIHGIRQNLVTGKKEKRTLLQDVAALKEDLLGRRSQVGGSSPDVSTLSIPTCSEKLSTASQTELSGESASPERRWGEIVRMRLQYDEAKKQVDSLQQELIQIDDQMVPGQNESDKDRLLLIQEKEQLLRELRGLNKRNLDEEDSDSVDSRIRQLNADLQSAMHVSSRQIAERLRLNEAKSTILHKLAEATKLTTYLEAQLKSASLSTLSLSSESSLGSLASLSASSSLNSLSLSLSDIYTTQSLPEVNLAELHRRVEKLLQGHSMEPIMEQYTQQQHPRASSGLTGIFSDSEPPPPPPVVLDSLAGGGSTTSVFESEPPPSYQQHVQKHQRGSSSSKLVTPDILPSVASSDITGSMTGITNPPLSPISESSSGMGHNLSGPNTRSVSVSNESVAGDSGVFEAATHTHRRPSDIDALFDTTLESAQVQIRLRYDRSASVLHISIEQARNLSALSVPDNCLVYIKTAVLPSSGLQEPYCTPVRPAASTGDNPHFNFTFSVDVPEAKLLSKTLQVNVWCMRPGSSATGMQQNECLGCAQVSLAAGFRPGEKEDCVAWYNVLSFRFMQQTEHVPPPHHMDTVAAMLDRCNTHDNTQQHNCHASSGEVRAPVIVEESSDESTTISSQTSTLTRNQGPEDMLPGNDSEAEEEEVEDEEEEEDSGSDTDQHTDTEEVPCSSHCEQCVRTMDAETNTEGARRSSSSSKKQPCRNTTSSTVRRSHTFTPQPQQASYICKLNRSDSDSCVRRGPFHRNTRDRRSIRYKKQERGPVMPAVGRTSLDLELDLAASRTRLSQVEEEIACLKDIKERFQHAKQTGDVDPQWLADNEPLQQFLSEVADIPGQHTVPHSSNSSNGGGGTASTGLEQKAQRKLRKLTSKVAKRQAHNHTDPHVFRAKMAFFVKPNVRVPIVEATSSTSDINSSSSSNIV